MTAKKAKKKVTAKKKTAKKATARKSPAKGTKQAKAASRPKKAAAAKKAAPSTKKVGTAKKTPGKRAVSTREKRLQDIRKRLVEQREGLLSEAELARNALPDQTVFPDLGDQATAETDRNFMLRLRGREQRLIKKIEEAIDRIDQGTFGICDMCGSEIGLKRLEVRPVTTLCIECKMEQEEEEKLKGE
jgi:DnaK suppressor protein